MTGQAFVIPRRTDLAGSGLLLSDLWPYSSQRNGTYDPVGQTFYLGSCLDLAGPTLRQGDSYAGGSLNTLLTAADDTAAMSTIDETTNNVLGTQTACLGLAAYLRERVQPGGLADPLAGRMTWGHANAQATAIANRVEMGLALSLSGINTVLCDPAAGGTAGTELTGDGGSKSFGTVEDILRLLSGEVYASPRYIIVCNVSNQFRSLAERTTLVAAQDWEDNGGHTFVTNGHFLDSTEPGYRCRPYAARNTAFEVSCSSGQIAHLKQLLTLVNPVFAYTAVEVSDTGKIRASTIAGNPLPETGQHPALAVYDSDGSLL